MTIIVQRFDLNYLFSGNCNCLIFTLIFYFLKLNKMHRMNSIQIALALFVIFIFIAVALVGCPTYNVWQQEMSGRAEFAKAEQNRRIKIEEAKANLEAERLNAEAEVERAKGAAEAIKIENGALTAKYIQYLWVRQQSALNDKTVIYIPTETNLPILEAGRLTGKTAFNEENTGN